jgi:lipopolysaccharide export LptBFGC system permease protein LptF
MREHWYVYLIIAVVAALLLWVFDKFGIIKSKSLRYFIVIFIASIVCWVVYDLVTSEL